MFFFPESYSDTLVSTYFLCCEGCQNCQNCGDALVAYQKLCQALEDISLQCQCLFSVMRPSDFAVTINAMSTRQVAEIQWFIYLRQKAYFPKSYR